MSHTDPAKQVAQTRAQRESRHQSELTGTRGRKDHKGGAPSSNKGSGEKMAR